MDNILLFYQYAFVNNPKNYLYKFSVRDVVQIKLNPNLITIISISFIHNLL